VRVVGLNGNGVGVGAGGSPVPSTETEFSLGDLKIPTRISQAQVGLRDIGFVSIREFAASIERMSMFFFFKFLAIDCG